MIWAFILSVIFVAGWTGATIQTGWAFMSLTLPFMIWRGPALPWPLQTLGLLAVTYAIASVSWADTPVFAIYGLWLHACVALAFIYGYKLTSLDATMRGFALGFSISSLLCIAQWLGWNPIVQFLDAKPAGLFFNPSLAGLGFGLIILWLMLRRQWLYIPALLPGLALNDTRSIWVGLAGTAWVWAVTKHRYMAFTAIPIAVALALYILNPSTNDSIRVQLWSVIYNQLTWLGHGPGIMIYALTKINGSFFRPEYAHNEYLNLIIQYGIGSVFAIVLALLPLTSKRSPEWYVYVTFLIVGIYSFALNSAPLAAIGAILAGHLSRDWSVACRDFCSSRPYLLPRHATT